MILVNGSGESNKIHIVIYSKQFDKSITASRHSPSSGGKFGHVIRSTKEATPDRGSRRKVSGDFYVNNCYFMLLKESAKAVRAWKRGTS